MEMRQNMEVEREDTATQVGLPANQMPFYNTSHDAIITSTGQQQLDDQPNSKWAIWCRNWCK